ncbi:MAG TPA: hypothetical protein DIV41_00355, partial [Ruminococcaceae bacterium]|nr:hypothetical protein [Oscillospiraceae bacterium]
VGVLPAVYHVVYSFADGQVGEMFVRREPYGQLAEGVATTSAMLVLGERYNADLPICKAVNDVINGGQDANTVLSNLFLRSIKMEF